MSISFVSRSANTLRVMGAILFFRKPGFGRTRAIPDVLTAGILCTWLVGIGRYWDNPRAETWQSFGLGSCVYIFILAALLYVIAKPLKPQSWSYLNVLTFVSITSLPGFFYAIPVELLFEPKIAGMANVIFLAIVATWRVALLFHYLIKAGRLSLAQSFVATLLPITFIVTVLTMLNLEHVVFELMAGIAKEDRSVNDAAYGVLVLITTASWTCFPFLLLAYVFQVRKIFVKSGE